MKKRIWNLLAVLMAVLFLFGCQSKEETKQDQPMQKSEQQNETKPNEKMDESKQAQDSKPQGHYPVTITSYNFSREPVEMTFDKAPEKVVAIYQSPIETMLALGLEDRIALAVMLDDPVKDEYKAAFEKIKYQDERPTKEEIMAMEPDMILSWYSLFSDKVYGDVGFWNERGTKTYIWQNAGLKNPNTLENEYQDILNIGKIFDVEDKAQEIVDRMNAEIEAAQKHIEGKDKVRALIIEVEGDGKYRVYGKDTIGGDIALRAGADLVGAELRSIGKEELLELNPDVLFSVYYGDSIVRDQATEVLMNDESLKTLSAVESKRVHPIVLSEVYASGVRTYDGIKTIISGLYPELGQ